jgi:hypothetical protein
MQPGMPVFKVIVQSESCHQSFVDRLLLRFALNN